MTNNTNKISLRSSAIIAGLAILIMAIAAPFAELYAFPKFVVPGKVSDTVNNILANEGLFRACIFSYLITFVCDLIAAWALYVLLKPVNEDLSLLTALFRLVYAVIALVALVNLISILRLLHGSDFESDELHTQIMLSFDAFRSGWYFGISFFGIHLGLLGLLVFKSGYIPRILGVLLIIAGLGYLINSLKPFLFPNTNLDFAKFTFYGELIFMFWLLIKGWRIQESN
jgi:Domain of unknown function (DUF4386)